MAGLRLPKRKHMSMKKLESYIKPERVYIPFISSNDIDITPLVKKGDYVYKGQILGRRKGNFKTPIFSSISGIVVDFCEVSHQSGKKVNAVVIENDYKEQLKEKYELRKNIDKITKEEFVNILEECGIVGMGGAGFPTFMKYKTDKKIKTLIVNAVECEPYITADYTVFMEKCEDILETIDDILCINDIDEAIIAIKETNRELIEKVNRYLGTYLRIRIEEVPNKYPMGWERTLIKQIKKIDYDKLPIEKGIVVNNVSTIYAINQALKYDKPIIERIVTFTGEGIKKPQNVLVKIGTKIIDVIKNDNSLKKEITLIANGPMMGSLTDEDLVITPDLNCVLVLQDKKPTRTKECLRCGKCVNFCPAYLSPVMIRDSIDNIDKLKVLHPEKCISCGLCSYVCPSKLDVRNYVQNAKEKLKGGK